MIVVFTLCSSNYLAHAKALGDSLIEHNPDYRFVIGLVDRIPDALETSYWEPHELIPVDKIAIPEFGEMVREYSVVELNTSVKPFYLQHLYRRNPEVDAVIYLDPDILVYSSFQPLEEKLHKYDIILTPHSCTFDDSPANLYYETGMLTGGIYNLGFIATARRDITFNFLKWWEKRVQNCCHFRQGRGVFVDQLWVALAPLYFSNIYIEKDPGYNMCYWNHFERRLRRRDGCYVVNDQHKLVFHHFSSYNPNKPERVTGRPKAQIPSFSERPDLKPIYDDYRDRLVSRGYARVSSLKYSLRRKPPKSKLTVKSVAKHGLRAFLRALPARFQTRVKGFAEFTADSCLAD
jgi:hypothetical protein